MSSSEGTILNLVSSIYKKNIRSNNITKQKLHIYLHDSSQHYIICQFYQIISCHRKMPECYTKVKGRKLNGYCPKNSNLIVPFKITCFCTFKSEVAPHASRGHLWTHCTCILSTPTIHNMRKFLWQSFNVRGSIYQSCFVHFRFSYI